MHEPVAIENGALFSGTRVIPPRSVSPVLNSQVVARKKTGRGGGRVDGIYASANFI